VLIQARDPGDAVIRQLANEQQAELSAAWGEVFTPFALRDGIQFVAAFVDGRAAGCGAIQPLAGEVAEIKRMFVRPRYRGQGYGRLILAALEELAVQRGFHTVRLETGTTFDSALRLYRHAGYRPIPSYGDYAGNPRSACFEKSLLTMAA
jgi:putative acetyltransferase